MHGHDYAVPGTYEITMVVAGRCPVFGEIVGTTKGGGEKPHLKPSVLGQTVLDCEIPKIHHHYPMVDVWKASTSASSLVPSKEASVVPGGD